MSLWAAEVAAGIEAGALARGWRSNRAELRSIGLRACDLLDLSPSERRKMAKRS